ncbi:MAG: hypothetical protein KAS01_00395 [Candidatus Pacebacteria bacterium]|nr:hypothetical protein [Candidatus Paceibacterota bacterium]
MSKETFYNNHKREMDELLDTEVDSKITSELEEEEKKREEILSEINKSEPLISEKISGRDRGLTLEQKKAKLKKLIEYLEILKHNNGKKAPLIVKGKNGVVIEQELEIIESEIKKIKKELGK